MTGSVLFSAPPVRNTAAHHSEEIRPMARPTYTPILQLPPEHTPEERTFRGIALAIIFAAFAAIVGSAAYSIATEHAVHSIPAANP